MIKEKLKIIPLGGLNEIGKNMTAIEYGNDIVVIDCGLAFPDDDMLGIDSVIPDVTYLKRNLKKVRGFLITHGHEDHIGSIPYVLREVNAPIYATRLTLGIIETKLAEFRMPQKVRMNTVKAGDVIRLGQFEVEFIHTNHSIADSVALAIRTPLGTIIHTGDFKVDLTPVDGQMIDLHRFAELGKQGVLLMMSDSTNVERPGYTMSEKVVGESFENYFKNCDSRIIIATFASNINRLQQILDIAGRYGRKVAVCGRSMEKITQVAMELGYLTDTYRTLIDINTIHRYPNNQVCIVSTGSQGETMSALYRMAYSSHKQVDVGPGDRILIAASAIPGNEKSVYNMINELYRQGAEVIYDRNAAIHVSGHACQQDLKLMLGLVRPKYFVPVHGEHRMLCLHAELAKEMGVDPRNIVVTEIGHTVEVDQKGIRLGATVPAGRVLVDGFGIGDVGATVLRDRKHLAEDGLLIIVVTIDKESGVVIAGPDIVSRGFIYVREAEDLMEELRVQCEMSLDRCQDEGIRDWNGIKGALKSTVSDYLFKKTKRSPMILPIIMEV
ncbi:MAG: ribonuclease J [Butyricicoccus sp.]|nr:ribonuclease J [Butyricicoccus sp.]MBQ8586014.1 ribonuclease J [Butyricicoccus sp.]